MFSSLDCTPKNTTYDTQVQKRRVRQHHTSNVVNPFFNCSSLFVIRQGKWCPNAQKMTCSNAINSARRKRRQIVFAQRDVQHWSNRRISCTSLLPEPIKHRRTIKSCWYALTRPDKPELKSQHRKGGELNQTELAKAKQRASYKLGKRKNTEVNAKCSHPHVGKQSDEEALGSCRL